MFVFIKDKNSTVVYEWGRAKEGLLSWISGNTTLSPYKQTSVPYDTFHPVNIACACSYTITVLKENNYGKDFIEKNNSGDKSNINRVNNNVYIWGQDLISKKNTLPTALVALQKMEITQIGCTSSTCLLLTCMVFYSF